MLVWRLKEPLFTFKISFWKPQEWKKPDLKSHKECPQKAKVDQAKAGKSSLLQLFKSKEFP